MTCVSTPYFDICLQFHSGVPMFIACDNPLRVSLSCFTTSLQKLHASFRALPFVLICHLLWHQSCINFVIIEVLMVMEYADSQLVSNLWTMSVTVIRLSSWTRALNRSALSAVCDVVGRPELSPLTTLDLPLWNLSTHWYTLFCVMQFSPYFSNVFLWMLEEFTSFDFKIEWQYCCSTMEQS
jgi:hypothetical protein